MKARQVTGQSFTDCLSVTTQPIAKAAPAVRQQLRVQRSEARRMRHRHQVIPAGEPNQTLHLAFVIALAGTAKPIRKQIVRLQFAEHTRPLPRIRATASLVLSYRIEAGTLPKKANAATWPAQNASVVSAG